jgi:hypothetical protein
VHTGNTRITVLEKSLEQYVSEMLHLGDHIVTVTASNKSAEIEIEQGTEESLHLDRHLRAMTPSHEPFEKKKDQLIAEPLSECADEAIHTTGKHNNIGDRAVFDSVHKSQ